MEIMMGMFDSVLVPCPACGERVEFQSKEGECCLNYYTLEDAPTPILCDVVNNPHYCRHCDNWMVLISPDIPPDQPPPRPTVKPASVKLSKDTAISKHSSQPYIRWWDSPFTYADLAEQPA